MLNVNTPLSLTDLLVNAGTLNAGETLLAPGLKVTGGTVTGPADLVIANSMEWSGGTLGGSGQLLLSDGADINIPSGVAVYGGRPINMSPGSEINWSGGRIEGDTPDRELVLDGDLNIDGAGNKALSELTLIQHGITTWADGNLQLNNGATFVNSADAIFKGQAEFLMYTERGATGTFVNEGTFRKSAGTGATRLGVLFNNVGTGTIDIQTGRLQVDGSRLSLDDESTVTNGSHLKVNGGTLAIDSQITVPHLHIDGGTLAVDAPLRARDLTVSRGTVTGAADLLIPNSAAMVWMGGTLGGTGKLVISEGASLTIPSGQPEYGGRPIDLTAPGSAVNWTGGTLTGSPLTLAGQLNISGTPAKTLDAITFTQIGTTTWTGVGNLHLDNAAIFNIAPGAVFDVQNDRTILTQRGQAGTFNNQGTFRKSAGTGANNVGVGGVTLVNSGALDVQTGMLQLEGGRMFLNSGTEVTPESRLNVSGGTLRIDTPVELTDLLIEDGLVALDSRLQAPGLKLKGGAITGAAELIIPTTMEWTGGTLGGTGNTKFESGAALNIPSGFPVYDGRPIDLSAPGSAMNWSGGTLMGSRELTLNGQLNLSGVQTKTLDAINLVQYGTTTWTGTGRLSVRNGALFHNAPGAVFDAQNDGILMAQGGTPGTFTNSGIFRRSATAPAATIVQTDSITFNNPGTIEVLSADLRFGDFVNTGTVNVQGGILFLLGTYTQTTGQTIVQGVLAAGAGGVHIQGGTLSGSGEIRAGVTNSGQVLPGQSPGILRARGFTQTVVGETVFEINGPDPGTGYDQLRRPAKSFSPAISRLRSTTPQRSASSSS